MQKWHKISVSLLGLLAIAILLVAVNLEDILIHRLNLLVEQDENRLYNYEYDQLEIDLSNGNIILTDLRFKPRIKIIDSLDQINKSKEKVFDIELEEFKMIGLGIFEFLITGTISLEEINFSSPNLKIYENTKYKIQESQEENSLKTEKEFFSDIISSSLKEANIGELGFQNAHLQIFKVEGKDTSLSLLADSSNFSIKGVKASIESISSKELFYYDSSFVDLYNVKVYSLEDYRIEVGRFNKSSTREDVHFYNVRLSPLEDRYTYMKNREYQTEWFDLYLKEITIEDLDIGEYQKSRSINANHFDINGIQLEIYKDKRLKNKKTKYKPLPSQILREIELAINVPTISLRDTRIEYQEMEVNALEPLQVTFKDFDLHISNFTTDSSHLSLNDTLKIDANGTFMQEGELALSLHFPILDSKDNFEIKGRLQKTKLNELNPILKNTAFVMFTAGNLNYLDFHMQGNKDKITGMLDLDYEGLNNLQILRKKDEMEERREKGKKRKQEKALLSFLANNIAPVDYKPSSKNYQTGQVYFERNTNKSIFHLLINGLKSGVLDSFLHNHEGIINKMKERKEK